MKSLPAVLAAVSMILPAALRATPPGMAEKLDAILRHPGQYSQICDATGYPMPAPIPGFRSVLHGEASLSEANLKFLAANRAEVLKAVAAKLRGIDLLRQAKEQALDPSIPPAKLDEVDATPRGVDPDCYSDILLEVIESLDGAVVFPELMELEEKFHALLVKAEQDPAAPLPVVDGTDGAGIYASNLPENEMDQEKLTAEQMAALARKRSVFRAQMAHRDILAVFVRVMRKNGFEPMLSSDLEKTYGKLLRDKWSNHEEFSKFKRAGDIPEDLRENVKFDPIHKVAYLTWDPVQIPFSEQTRTRILELTKQFVTRNTTNKPEAP
ncbi:MAG: hypothetical protein KA004_05250 [Verrucomicrobiales bacterium]|nr:hypothetical protein [Verrucomicrobiales bacterium]